LRQCGLAGAGRTPQNDERKKFIGFDGAAQEFAFADNVLLTDLFIQLAWPHACGKRSFGFHIFLHDVTKEIRHQMIQPCEIQPSHLMGKYSWLRDD